jgi:hypothetical protein
MKEYVYLKANMDADDRAQAIYDMLDDLKDKYSHNDLIYYQTITEEPYLFDVYLYTDGLSIGAGTQCHQILWAKNTIDSNEEQFVALNTSDMIQLSKDSANASHKEVYKDLEQLAKDGKLVKVFYSFSNDSMIRLMQPDVVEELKREGVEQIDEYTAFVAKDIDTYNSIYYKVYHRKDGTKRTKVMMVQLTNNQYRKILSLIRD